MREGLNEIEQKDFESLSPEDKVRKLIATNALSEETLIEALDNDSFDVAVFDGEARPGGMGLSHQIKDEIPDAPPVVLLIARAADAWMATWSRAEGISPYPIDPIRLPDDVAQVVRDTRAGRTNPLSSGVVIPGSGSRHRVG